jgi:hypothetical protein
MIYLQKESPHNIINDQLLTHLKFLDFHERKTIHTHAFHSGF